MTTAKKTNSANPARSAAAKKAAETRKRQAEEQAAQAAAEIEAAKLAAREAFQNYDPGVPVLDADGFEIVPDRKLEAGGTYKFVVDGQRYELPNLQYLPYSLAQQVMSRGEDEVMTEILDRYAPAMLDHASPDQILHITKRWTQHSQGLTLGE